MNITLKCSGDPWMDWGIVAFYDFCLVTEEDYWEKLTINNWQVEMQSYDDVTSEELADEIIKYLRTKLNEIILPSPELKLLGYEDYRKPDKNGFYNPDYAVKFSEPEKKQLKEKLNHTVNNGTVTLRRNYVGIAPDWKKLAEDLPQTVTSFIKHQSISSAANEQCPMCGRFLSKETFKTLQNRNPFYNKRHTKMRGYRSTADNDKMCATCNFLNVFAAVHCYVPYFIGEKKLTHLILPQTVNIKVLHKVYRRIRENLIDLNSPDVLSYRTNIKELPKTGVYQALLALYFSLMHKYSPTLEAFTEKPAVDRNEQQFLTNWVVLRFVKGKNVNFFHFNNINTDNRLFELVRMRNYGRNHDKQGDIVRTFFKNIRCRDLIKADKLAKGIVQADWDVVAKSLFALIKDAKKNDSKTSFSYNGISFFKEFCSYALKEVDELMDEQLLNDLKKIGKVIGRYFPNDISLMTKINNIYDQSSLNSLLGEVAFKIQKYCLAAKKDGDNETINEYDKKDFAYCVDRVLRTAPNFDVKDLKNVLLIYACSEAALNIKRENEVTK